MSSSPGSGRLPRWGAGAKSLVSTRDVAPLARVTASGLRGGLLVAAALGRATAVATAALAAAVAATLLVAAALGSATARSRHPAGSRRPGRRHRRRAGRGRCRARGSRPRSACCPAGPPTSATAAARDRDRVTLRRVLGEPVALAAEDRHVEEVRAILPVTGLLVASALVVRDAIEVMTVPPGVVRTSGCESGCRRRPPG